MSDSEKAVKTSDSPSTREDKLIKNENETVKVESVKPATPPKPHAALDDTNQPPLPKPETNPSASEFPTTHLIPTAVDPKDKQAKVETPATGTPKIEIPGINLPPQQ